MRNLFVVVCLAAAAACSKSPAGPTTVASLTTPIATTPSAGAQIANGSQPITLTVTNATLVNGTGDIVYTFEVATDSGFATKVFAKDVPETPGQTSVKVDTLPASKEYFWHARASSGQTVGSFSTTSGFSIGAAITIQAPTPALPAGNAPLGNAQPTLTVNNSAKSGPTGTISYTFEIATDAGFSNIVVTATVSEGSSQTSFTPSSKLSYSTTYYWHARAKDITNNVSSAFSSTASFVTVSSDNDIWPGAQPPGTTGHAVKGDNWQEQELISFGGTHFHSPTLEMKRLFDLMDRGMNPQEAIDWMHNNGYPTEAAYYSRIDVIGVKYVYLALINGRWDVILRGEGD